jgi:hypothetical protein
MPIPLLVTLDDAKRHLRITDTDHDGDIGAKLDEANETIYNYLKSRADDTWTDATAPREVTAAIKLYLGHLYEHRGDEFGDENDDRVWNAIGNVLRRLRDPALA